MTNIKLEIKYIYIFILRFNLLLLSSIVHKFLALFLIDWKKCNNYNNTDLQGIKKLATDLKEM